MTMKLTQHHVDQYNEVGFTIVEDFASLDQCQTIMDQAHKHIEERKDVDTLSIFTTNEQTRHSDRYFLDSANNISLFFEEEAVQDGKLVKDIFKAVNKIAHAQHKVDPVYKEFVESHNFREMAKMLGHQDPNPLQSMHIFKQPHIGGEVDLHQDSTFLWTEPNSCIGFWLALEDATIENGCLQILPKGQHVPIKKMFHKDEDENVTFEILDGSPWPDDALEIVEVKAGTLVIFHGNVPHYSASNRSGKSRQAYTLHVIDNACEFPATNWIDKEKQASLQCE